MPTGALSLSGAPPWLIQGGMGIAVSHWPLARAVSLAGQLGVVSGTAIDAVFARRLQRFGVDDALRRVLARFPLQDVVKDVVARYGPRRAGARLAFRPVPMPSHSSSAAAQDLMVLAAYAEVAQAKEGHSGRVGINLLTKVQIPTVPTLFGAMLAGVDWVLMGAGIPSHIPAVLDQLARGEVVETSLDVSGRDSTRSGPTLRFDPRRWLAGSNLHRPRFLAVVSSHVLALALARRTRGVDGFIVESPVAGGHNAPPRGALQLDDSGNPLYGARDDVDYATMRELEVPFWVAGGVSTREDVIRALDLGATGVQVGTLFAFCRESGISESIRRQVTSTVTRAPLHVRTSVRASSTGYPFKLLELPGTLSEPDIVAQRPRVCDMGYLREAFVRDSGTVGYRCAAEPEDAYRRKAGDAANTADRLCLCNGLMATADLAQVRDGVPEPAIVTSGDDVNRIVPLLQGREDYSAADVIAYLQP